MNTSVSLSSIRDLEILYADPPAPYLDPDVLSEEAKRAAEAFEVEGTSPNTRRTYRTALLYWGAWYALRYGRLLPAPVPVPAVIQFILDHLEHNPLEEPVEPSPFVPSSRNTQHLLPPAIDRVLVARAYKAKLGPWSLATVKTRLAALSRAHDVFIASQIMPLPASANPLRDPSVRQLLSVVQRAYARRPPEHERRPPIAATRQVMEALLATARRIWRGSAIGRSCCSDLRVVADAGRRSWQPLWRMSGGMARVGSYTNSGDRRLIRRAIALRRTLSRSSEKPPWPSRCG
jgi:hypothetical protein